jgi:hypothetical protein
VTLQVLSLTSDLQPLTSFFQLIKRWLEIKKGADASSPRATPGWRHPASNTQLPCLYHNEPNRANARTLAKHFGPFKNTALDDSPCKFSVQQRVRDPRTTAGKRRFAND